MPSRAALAGFMACLGRCEGTAANLNFLLNRFLVRWRLDRAQPRLAWAGRSRRLSLEKPPWKKHRRHHGAGNVRPQGASGVAPALAGPAGPGMETTQSSAGNRGILGRSVSCCHRSHGKRMDWAALEGCRVTAAAALAVKSLLEPTQTKLEVPQGLHGAIPASGSGNPRNFPWN